MQAMKTSTVLAIVLATATVAGGLGYHLGRRPADDGTTAAAQADPASARRPTVASRFAHEPTAPVDDALARQVARASSDPAYLQQLLARYRSESEPDRKGAVLAILQSIANQDVQRFALELAGSADSATRRDGLSLLSAYSMEEAPVRQLLVRQIGREQDPALLKQMVEMLAPAPIASEDVTPMLDQLARLRQHDDPGVRAASVLQSAQWDKSAGAEDMLQRALLDPEAQVREAAIAGVTSSSVRSDRIKDALLDIASNPHSGDDERAAAVFALQAFSLDRAEYGIYRAAAGAMPADGMH